MKKTGSEEFHEWWEAVKNDTDFWIQGALGELAVAGNPYYAWMTVQVCIEHDIPFPEPVIVYLAQCAQRMLSDKAKTGGRDLRKVLPWIFGFPNAFDPVQRKQGPGNLLNPAAADPKAADVRT